MFPTTRAALAALTLAGAAALTACGGQAEATMPATSTTASAASSSSTTSTTTSTAEPSVAPPSLDRMLIAADELPTDGFLNGYHRDSAIEGKVNANMRPMTADRWTKLCPAAPAAPIPDSSSTTAVFTSGGPSGVLVTIRDYGTPERAVAALAANRTYVKACPSITVDGKKAPLAIQAPPYGMPNVLASTNKNNGGVYVALISTTGRYLVASEGANPGESSYMESPATAILKAQLAKLAA